MQREAAPRDGVVVLSAKDRAELGLRTESVRRVDLRPAVEAAGTVGFAPRHFAAVGSRVSGVVRSVRHIVGDVVAEGEVLAIVDSADLASFESDAAVLRARMRAATSHADRATRLLEGGYSTARTVESSTASKNEIGAKLNAAERLVSTLGGGSGRGAHAIRAPRAGTVVTQRLSVGQSVRDDQIAFEIADTKHLWVEVAVEEKYIQGVDEGDEVLVTPLGKSNVVLRSHVASVGSKFNEGTLTVPVRIVIDDPNHELRAGQSVRARLHPSGLRNEGVLVVPRSSVVFVDGKSIVFLGVAENGVAPTSVELGDSDGDDQRIVSGVSADSVVVTNGAVELRQRLYR